MTLDIAPTTKSTPEPSLSRRVSSLAVDERKSSPEGESRKRLRPSLSSLARQVSHDVLTTIADRGKENTASKHSGGRGSPVRCVSEYDKVAAPSATSASEDEESLFMDPEEISAVPPFPNLLQTPTMVAHHTMALRLEAELHPLRLILSRLMSHPTLNRKGIFNVAVDAEKLGLMDYFNVIKKPMDLGTIKARLHAVAYDSRQEVVDDIRLVFKNAMTYNPPQNAVHSFAQGLLAFFEDQLRSFVPELAHWGEGSPPEAPSTDQIMTHADTFSAQATRKSTSGDSLLSPSTVTSAKKRKKRGSKVKESHSCQFCEGRFCAICEQGCLQLEPTLLICSGPNCAGSRIRKSATYYIASDGSRQYCQRCYTGLPAVLAATSSQDDKCRYKRDLLKRRNDEEVAERWLTCTRCEKGFHQVCALFNEHTHSLDSFICPYCNASSADLVDHKINNSLPDDTFTFVAASELPVKTTKITGSTLDDLPRAKNLPETDISSFIEQKVRERMMSKDCPNAEKTIFVRVISDCNRSFFVPDVVRKHFGMSLDEDSSSSTPLKVNYRSKAIALFQIIDGLDVCIFCMYVQEYGGNDLNEGEHVNKPSQKKRVYIAYLDSVEHFRPRDKRTAVYQEMLVAYLASARKRGYKMAHIWACPPSRGNSFVFWNHPASQRTPNRERLISWYHGALSRAVQSGVVTDVKSLYESDFQSIIQQNSDGESSSTRSPVDKFCPPLLEGDFWIEEAVRLHTINMTRHLKSKVGGGDHTIPGKPFDEQTNDPCPARQVAKLLREKVIASPLAVPFRRPVNAAAMKLSDYHKIIVNPMDLGTIYSRCLLGEYSTLIDLVEDVELVFSNAKRYNPKGHYVHIRADEVRLIFFNELDSLASAWYSCLPSSERHDTKRPWELYKHLSMSLDFNIQSNVDRCIKEEQREMISSSVKDNSDGKAKSLNIDLISGGPDAVQYRMVGEDTWLLEKKCTFQKVSGNRNVIAGKRKHSLFQEEDSIPKRRRQSWLREEVGAAVRRHRTSFFTCSLTTGALLPAEKRKLEEFAAYTKHFSAGTESEPPSKIADARHALLEFSQFRNLEFDTLRRAKYSTAILLYHLHHQRAPGMVPVCSACSQDIQDVRWHKISRISEYKAFVRASASLYSNLNEQRSIPEELCSKCFEKTDSKIEQFIPIQVSFQS